jgi:hypothetical protein
LLHYGFSSIDRIIKKYLTYKSYGQTGWSLDRLITENPQTFAVSKCPKELYPQGEIPHDYDTALPLRPISMEEVKRFRSWEEFVTNPLYHTIIGRSK